MEVWLLAVSQRGYLTGIKRLVYLDGYIPEDGKTAFDLIPGLEENT
jgi:hypothetical protein